jgi:hypothetical protein
VSGNDGQFGARLQDRLLAAYYCLLLLEKNLHAAQKMTALMLRILDKLNDKQAQAILGTLRDLCAMTREVVHDFEVALNTDD